MFVPACGQNRAAAPHQDSDVTAIDKDLLSVGAPAPDFSVV
ncbi:MAG: hypothetical protein QOI66_5431, partial [Myxococcales bacterium]|nr:hypothetical protein [Myxococcales bacterium]